jgi:hypothetical protein
VLRLEELDVIFPLVRVSGEDRVKMPLGRLMRPMRVEVVDPQEELASGGLALHPANRQVRRLVGPAVGHFELVAFLVRKDSSRMSVLFWTRCCRGYNAVSIEA